jgi:hypothetical protein
MHHAATSFVSDAARSTMVVVAARLTTSANSSASSWGTSTSTARHAARWVTAAVNDRHSLITETVATKDGRSYVQQVSACIVERKCPSSSWSVRVVASLPAVAVRSAGYQEGSKDDTEGSTGDKQVDHMLIRTILGSTPVSSTSSMGSKDG